jgi:hypothetical protein
MATGKHEPHAVVWNVLATVVRFLRRPNQFGVGFQLFCEAGAPAYPIDRFETRCLDDPGPREFRNSVCTPLFDCGGKGFLCGFFSNIEVADQANEGSYNPSPLGLVDRFNGSAASIGMRPF